MSHPKTLEEIETCIARCRYPGFVFKVAGGIDDPWFQVVCPEGIDTTTNEPIEWKGRKWKLSKWMTDTEIVHTVWAAVQRALMHEASELFKFDGVAIFDRHLSVHLLADLARREDALDGRDEIHS
ncbi:hypothetical protein KIKIMORA_01740 [Brevundimonas phage vB_BpoS-Kikimora]|uniref:Uncharacterized protein n=1 Tax=Brevundimonas phage vB_BpoS-Kikimora TaxID=2948601 RepID=A0A9E7MSL4_9CAUD|nr:hypothetical protein KIKIMORA_01740 [Brevundimonas phage vB_BpoS-Kikimora]